MTAHAYAAAAALALLPIPTGVGPRFHPAPATHGACRPGPIASRVRVHLELFAARRVVVVPPGIGLRGARFRYGRATAARCRAALWTFDPSGIVRYRGAHRLGDLFRVWGRSLEPDRLLSFRGRVRLYKNGIRLRVDPRRLMLRNGDEIVLEVGPYVPPHHAYRFPP